MIRDFSLVFLLLISDRRNLHRDSRRDTEQNVPCAVVKFILLAGAHFFIITLLTSGSSVTAIILVKV